MVGSQLWVATLNNATGAATGMYVYNLNSNGTVNGSPDKGRKWRQAATFSVATTTGERNSVCVRWAASYTAGAAPRSSTGTPPQAATYNSEQAS